VTGLLVAAVVTGGVAQGAAKRGYTCSYRMSGSGPVFTTLDGYDNSPTFCRAFVRGGARRVGYVYGKVWCAWRGYDSDVRIVVRSRSKLWASAICLGYDSVDQSMFRRTVWRIW
jgi:hypothetical protein